ncbi:MAG: hypothetical protein E6Q55_33640 [Mycolicibacterium mageritense]|uniref:Uncharacterized protein n=2 Tax=Mycolicibacterium TaxID=1866885 RepID=A0A6H0RX30_9MYCO|nr:hypothetical protein Mspyr1_55680 [Mycolicibacterium gilvum Spyr1]QIV79763.1 hypothetical protein EXE63_01760 [Mycolicibacterium frederiksbergense]TXI54038.1 MAG: hypothetical protein E6Q55_33640 [Mycolicibacterium mageritense]
MPVLSPRQPMGDNSAPWSRCLWPRRPQSWLATSPARRAHALRVGLPRLHRRPTIDRPDRIVTLVYFHYRLYQP